MFPQPENHHLPKISVVIPLYNKAPHIARALDSVLAQTVQDFEVIVVGGKSNDNGEDIVRSYNDSRIHLIDEKGEGVSAARNQGVDAARAELVAFLDADDEWLPQFLETILRLREKYPEAGLYGTGYYLVKNEIRTPHIYGNDISDKLFSYICAVNLNNGSEFIMTSAHAVPRDIIYTVGGFPISAKRSEDRCFRAKVALLYPTAYCPKPYVYYHKSVVNGSILIPDYHVDPFSEYISSLDNYSLSLMSVSTADIKKFCDWSILIVTSANLLHGHNPQQLRTDLCSVTTNECKFTKIIIVIGSYVPIDVRNYVIRAYHILFHNK